MRRRTHVLICLSLAATTLCVYGQVVGFQFVGLDDPQYVSANPVVRAGVTAEGIAWALRSSAEGSWVPLTMLSHMWAWPSGSWRTGRQGTGGTSSRCTNACWR